MEAGKRDIPVAFSFVHMHIDGCFVDPVRGPEAERPREVRSPQEQAGRQAGKYQHPVPTGPTRPIAYRSRPWVDLPSPTISDDNISDNTAAWTRGEGEGKPSLPGWRFSRYTCIFHYTCTCMSSLSHLSMSVHASPKLSPPIPTTNQPTNSHHYKSCTRLPAQVRAQIEQAKTQPGRKRQSKSNSKDYWSQSAREAGLVDDNGIFFADSDEVQEEVGVEQEQVDEEKEEEEEEEVQASAAVDEAAPLPFDSIALFGPGLGLIDDDEDDGEDGKDDGDHQEVAIAAAEKPHKVEQGAAQEYIYPSSAPAPAPVSHHTTTSEADDAMLHEALAILSDDAEDEVGSEDGGGTFAGFEPLPMKEELRSAYSTAMSIPQPPTTANNYPPSNTLTTATDLGCSTGTRSGGSAQGPTAWYGSRGPSHTRDQHPLAYSSGLFSSSGTSSTAHHHHHHGQQYPQPRRLSTMGSSYRTAAEQQHHRQMYHEYLAWMISPLLLLASFFHSEATQPKPGPDVQTTLVPELILNNWH